MTLSLVAYLSTLDVRESGPVAAALFSGLREPKNCGLVLRSIDLSTLDVRESGPAAVAFLTRRGNCGLVPRPLPLAVSTPDGAFSASSRFDATTSATSDNACMYEDDNPVSLDKLDNSLF